MTTTTNNQITREAGDGPAALAAGLRPASASRLSDAKEETMTRFKADPGAVYFCDNGATYCGDHLGMTAQMTGRDISGQRIDRLTSADVYEGAQMGIAFACETCGKEAK